MEIPSQFRIKYPIQISDINQELAQACKGSEFLTKGDQRLAQREHRKQEAIRFRNIDYDEMA